jgi:hypothetical protein
MVQQFIAFNINAASNLIYTVTENAWYVAMLAGVCITVVLRLSASIRASFSEDHFII